MNPRAKLSTEQAAIYLGVSVSTMKRMRASRTGPAYIRLEPSRMIRYELWALDQWVADRRKRGN
ncbi:MULTISPECIES: helix-turn-helix transcriptional regulator [Bifidobacterium]